MGPVQEHQENRKSRSPLSKFKTESRAENTKKFRMCMKTTGFYLSEKLVHDCDLDELGDISQWSRRGFVKIFNAGDERDGKRLQCSLVDVSYRSDRKSALNKIAHKVGRTVRRLISRRRENWPKILTDFNLIYSLPGCKEQDVHTDYQRKEGFKFPKRVKPGVTAFGVIFALMDGCQLKVWPESWRLFEKSEEDLKDKKPIKGCVIPIPRGHMVVFRGDLYHAGMGYDAFNARLHSYVEWCSSPLNHEHNTTNRENRLDLLI